jgi:hypothetical protein
MNDLVPVDKNEDNEPDPQIFAGIMGLMFDIEVIISDTSPRNTLTIDRQSYNRLKRRWEEGNNERK